MYGKKNVSKGSGEIVNQVRHLLCMQLTQVQSLAPHMVPSTHQE